jgi:predicted acetyltransferase
MELRRTKEKAGWRVEALEGERAVSRLWIVDRKIRIGASSVRIGGIAGVGTDREYRKRGLARHVLQEAVALMWEEAYDGSFLFGIRDFYDKFGYVTCMPERRLYLETRDAERATKALGIRPMRPADLPAIVRLYNRDNATRTASVVRRAGTWDGFPMGSQFGISPIGRVITDAGRRVVGYVVYDDTKRRVRAAEVGGNGIAVHGTILRHLAERAVRLRCQELSCSIPVDHPFARFCRQFGCRDSTHFAPNAGPMGRIINLGSFLGKVAGELESRWGSTEREMKLTLRTDLGSCSVGWENGSLRMAATERGGTRVQLTQDALMVLMMGYRTPADLLSSGQLRAPQAVRGLLERLFPQQQAHMWWPDRF